jgi:hypothetical protein
MPPRIAVWQKLTLTLLVLAELGFVVVLALVVWTGRQQPNPVRLAAYFTIGSAAGLVLCLIGAAITKLVRAVRKG